MSRRRGRRHKPRGWRDPGPKSCQPAAPPSLQRHITRLEADLAICERAQALEKKWRLEEASQLYAELFRRNSQGDTGEALLASLTRVAIELWGEDRDRHPQSVAIAFAEEAARRRPDSANARAVLGILYQCAGRALEAQPELEAAVALNPGDLGAWGNLAACNLSLGRLEHARECYTKVLVLPPQSASDRHSQANALLITGRYGEGWRVYPAARDEVWERRLQETPFPHPLRSLVIRPQWGGSPTDGHVVLRLEGGFGDGFMMARWIPRVRARVGALTLLAKPELIRFLARQFQDVDIMSIDGDPGAFDCWTHADWLPHLFGVEHPEDVMAAPYLRATHQFRDLGPGFKVGFVWAGSPREMRDLVRSTPLPAWLPVLTVPGVSFYSLQLGKAGQLEALGLGSKVLDLSGELTGWSDTAAAMSQLDLVIACDTAVAHLAGALGLPVWLCMNAEAEWRWMLEREDTPWYGSARLFRQPVVGDWESVFAQVARELRELVRSRAGASAA